MKLDEVPQDHSSTYGGHRKLLYAVDAEGHYRGARSDGWEAESYATRQALDELQRLSDEAERDWRAGRVSVLKCLMYRYRLDEPALAQVTGLWQWRVRRHFHPERYRRLGATVLRRYAEAFGLPLEQLIGYQKDRP